MPSGFDDIMRVSSMTSMPSWSQASSSSGVGGLCEVRMALQPISWSLRIAVVLHGVRQCSAHAGVVLVVAGALQFHGLAVEEEAVLRIEPFRPDAEAGYIVVDRGRRPDSTVAPRR